MDYLKFSKRKDLIPYFPKKIKIEQRYFNKNELISRNDLNLLLENVSPKLKSLIMDFMRSLSVRNANAMRS